MEDWLARAAREWPDRIAVEADGRAVTYAALDEAAGRRALTIAPGSVVPIPLPPGVEHVELLHAAWRAGAVALPLGPGADAPAGLDPPAGSALVILTSGTTGAPKPVALTRANLEASARASAGRFPLGPGDRWLCPLPLHHVGGASIPVRCVLAGATAVIHERFDVERVRRTLEAGEVTYASLVPTMLVRLREHRLEATPGLKAILLGGGPIPPALLEWADASGIPAVPVYGMTETASQVVAGSPGRPLDGVELAIAADGEILVRGPMVAPAELSPDGWLHTGDGGRLDEEGRLHVEGRLKEVIVTGGENVSPVEVEAALVGHPDVIDAGVVGVPDPEWGEAVTAFVVARAETSPAALRDWCRQRLAPHKVPKGVVLVDALPRNAAGKLLRDRLIKSRA